MMNHALAAAPAEGVRPLRVSELNDAVNGLLGDAFAQVWVEGEISGWKVADSGHVYFALKEGSTARLECAMWKSNANRLQAGVEFRDGVAVFAGGRLGIYKVTGRFQLYVDRLALRGLGAAEEALRRLHEKLLAKGYFRPENKRTLPRYPRRVAVVTSGKGDAVHDIMRRLRERWPVCDVVVCPVRVQGDGAAEDIAAALDRLNRLRSTGRLETDVIIIGRGGGSLEDLWAFNSETLADAIHRSTIPVVSGVGHELNTSISDFVADFRATTPTNAADEVTRHWAEIGPALTTKRKQLADALTWRLDRSRQRLDALASRRVFRQPLERLRDREQRLDLAGQRLRAAAARLTERRGQQVAAVAARLDALSPLNVLGRGYSLTQTGDRAVVRDAKQVAVGEVIVTRLHRGRLTSQVLSAEAGDP